MRDPDYKCVYCGKYVAYDDIPDKVKVEFIPDSHRSSEKTWMYHKTCKESHERNKVQIKN